jgi:hypothetical protein
VKAIDGSRFVAIFISFAPGRRRGESEQAVPQVLQPFQREIVDVLMNMGMAMALSMVIDLLYRATHTEYSYNRGFTMALVACGMLVAMIIMAGSNTLGQAVATVAMMSVIRFRTANKDPRDLSYIFLPRAPAWLAARANSCWRLSSW